LIRELGSIPSPSNGVFHVGPIPVHPARLFLAVGIVSAAWLAERRWSQRSHPPNEITDLAFWVVIAGVIGARPYHVITDYELYSHDAPEDIFGVADPSTYDLTDG
jgi:prolipoprotein diacylglyceryltransferase